MFNVNGPKIVGNHGISKYGWISKTLSKGKNYRIYTTYIMYIKTIHQSELFIITNDRKIPMSKNSQSALFLHKILQRRIIKKNHFNTRSLSSFSIIISFKLVLYLKSFWIFYCLSKLGFLPSQISLFFPIYVWKVFKSLIVLVQTSAERMNLLWLKILQ